MNDGSDPARWYATNLVGVPASVLASAAFNQHPVALHIAGAREGNPGLFALLAKSRDEAEARVMFEHYMTLAFGLAKPEPGAPPPEARRWRASYLKLLQGWGLDANGAAGAVLKGWAESRFGLAPAFHKAPLARFPSPAWVAYLTEKAASRFHNNNVFQQLDLLYEFSQWRLLRFAPLGPGPTVTLWRGSTRCEEQVVSGSLRARRCTVRLNNVVSFSRTREQAGCFGDWLLGVRVPLVKLLLWPGLLDTASLDGESEVIALGGDYDVEARYE
ncbi:MAG: NAD(+) ADP-ribosyltransferase [Rubrivivax sp.]|nr:NAD(+) ADP-ribosyltransferase [Rubrivivax sp.]